jgi:hypothetical protein
VDFGADAFGLGCGPGPCGVRRAPPMLGRSPHHSNHHRDAGLRTAPGIPEDESSVVYQPPPRRSLRVLPDAEIRHPVFDLQQVMADISRFDW